jgi:hypothetical protein
VRFGQRRRQVQRTLGQLVCAREDAVVAALDEEPHLGHGALGMRFRELGVEIDGPRELLVGAAGVGGHVPAFDQAAALE